jgi:hypothetical protein
VNRFLGQSGRDCPEAEPTPILRNAIARATTEMTLSFFTVNYAL